MKIKNIKVHYFCYIVALSFILISCKGTKGSTKKDGDGSISSAAIALQNIKDNNISAMRFNASADLNIQSSAFNGGAKAKFRVIKDSLLWVSVSKFGFEGARILITQDSLFAVERLGKTYIKASFHEISDQIGFELSFKFLEDFILGNPYLSETENLVKMTASDTINVFPVLSDYKIQHSFLNSDYRVRLTNLRDEKTKVEAILSYDDYQELESGAYFSYLRSIIVDALDEEESSVSIKFSKPEINVEKSFKFSIPENYTARSL